MSVRDKGDLRWSHAAETFAASRPPIRSRWPVYGEEEIAAVVDVLRSGQVNALVHGDRCRAFENAFADHVGSPYAIALANGTLALELGLRALGIGAGDEVIVTPRSFFASVSCVVACGARPVFADVDPVSQDLDPDGIEAVITARTRAILCVHLAGWPCDMEPILRICRDHGLRLIEDCAQAHGATYHGRQVGSFGDVAAFSFCTDKIMSTGGEGGMLLAQDGEVWKRAWAYKDHGKNPEKVFSPPDAAGAFRWLHDGFGSNYRMTEMQAAIGLVQLGKLPGWLAARRANARILHDALRPMPLLRVPRPTPDIEHAYYKYYAFLRPLFQVDGQARDEIVADLQLLGVPCGSGSCPEIYREDAFQAPALRHACRLPIARELGMTSLMVPVDPTLDAADMHRMAAAIRLVVAERLHRGIA